jgi:hypothetical protein
VNVGSLFSGIGGLDHGLHRAGLRHVFFCEADPWRRDVLAARWPGVPIYDDVRGSRREPDADGRCRSADTGVGARADAERQWARLPGNPTHVDLLCGGFPCQDLSVAGQRARARRGTLRPLPSSSPVSSTLFDPDGFSSRTYPDCSLATAVGTSESCLERWPTSGTAWHGGFSTHVSSECRSDADGCSSSEPSLTEILQPPQTVPARYSLSARAAQGILRRAEKRGKSLPDHLLAALSTVAWPSHSEHIAQ